MTLKKKKKIIKTKNKSKRNSETGLTKFASLTQDSQSETPEDVQDVVEGEVVEEDE